MGAGSRGTPYIESFLSSAQMYRELTRATTGPMLTRTEATTMTSEILDAFFRDGWNGHDVDVR